MKTKILTALCVAGLLMSTWTQAAPSQDNSSGEQKDTDTQYAPIHNPSAVAVAADVLLARPMCLVATVVGSALFVVALPVAAISKSVKPTANVLVVKPAKATFTRPLGDLEDLKGS